MCRLAPRYAQLYSLIFCTLAFSSAMPILLWITALDLMLWYAMDALLFFSSYRRPPLYSDRIAAYAARLLPKAAVIHLAVACWAYSAAFVETETYGVDELTQFMGRVQSESAARGVRCFFLSSSI